MIKRMIGAVLLLLSIMVQAAFSADEITQLPPITGSLFTFSYLGNSLILRTVTPAWFYQFAGIKSTTSGFNFSNCSYSDNGFCLFPVSDIAPRTFTLSGPAIQPEFTLCLNGLGRTYSCQKLKMGKRFAFVTNAGNNTVSLCPINSSNGTFGNCTASAVVFNQPTGITLNSAGTLAYVGNTDPSATTVSLCPIHADGTFGTCVNPGGTFERPSGIILNSSGTFAYVPNFGGTTVSICPINSDGTFGTCTASAAVFSSI